MSKQKQEIPFSFKVSNAMKTAIDQECEIENRSQSDMAKILIAEGLSARVSKRNIHKLL